VHLSLAVECKNIRPYQPLLLTAVPRTEAESFHDRIEFTPGSYSTSSKCIRLSGSDSAYPVGESVGKKTDQVGRENTADAELVSDDSATFEKLNQAVNSWRDLVRYYGLTPHMPYLRVIVPVLVVPDGALWQVDYTADGTMTKEPRVIPATTLFLGGVGSSIEATDCRFRIACLISKSGHLRDSMVGVKHCRMSYSKPNRVLTVNQLRASSRPAGESS
jgi:hypothetical protein